MVVVLVLVRRILVVNRCVECQTVLSKYLVHGDVSVAIWLTVLVRICQLECERYRLCRFSSSVQ